jgi:predicted Zn-dependent protease
MHRLHRNIAFFLVPLAVGCSTFGPKSPGVITENDAQYFRDVQGKLPSGDAVSKTDSLIAMARFYGEAQRAPLAERMYEKALAADPKSVQAHLGLIKLQMDHRQWDRVETSLRRARQAVPESAAIWNEVAACDAKRNNISRAITAAKRACELAPEVELYRSNLANLYLSAGQPELAIKEYSYFLGPGAAQRHVAELLASMPSAHSSVDRRRSIAQARHESVENADHEIDAGWNRSQRREPPQIRQAKAEEDEREVPSDARPYQGWRNKTQAHGVGTTPSSSPSSGMEQGTVTLVEEEDE